MVRKKGLTVIEMIVALVSGIVIILTIGYILYYGNKTIKREEKVIELKREAVFGIRFIERKLREKKPEQIEIQESGKKLIIKKWKILTKRNLKGIIKTMKKYYLFLIQVLLIGFILGGCECGPGTIEEPIERPEPELPPPSPPSTTPTSQNEYFMIEGNNLVYFDGENKYYSIKGKVEDLKFEKVKGAGNSYYITVNLKLKDGQIKTDLNSIIALRNTNRTINFQQSGSFSESPPPYEIEPVQPPQPGPPFPPPGWEERY